MQQRGVVLDTLNKTIKLRIPDKNVDLLIIFPNPPRVVKKFCVAPVQQDPNKGNEKGMDFNSNA